MEEKNNVQEIAPAEATTAPQNSEAVKITINADALLNMTQEEREAFFEEHGKGIMKRYFDRPLTEDESNSMKNDLYELNLDLMAKTQEKADYVKSIGEQIKSLQTQMNSVTNDIRKGVKEVYEPCVKVLDMDSRKVYFFAQSDGSCVFTRNITGEDLEQTFPFETVFNVVDNEGNDVELVVARHGGFPAVDDETSNKDGFYTMDEGTVVEVDDGKIVTVDRHNSSKYVPLVGDVFEGDGKYTLLTGYVINVENDKIVEVINPDDSDYHSPQEDCLGDAVSDDPQSENDE